MTHFNQYTVDIYGWLGSVGGRGPSCRLGRRLPLRRGLELVRPLSLRPPGRHLGLRRVGRGERLACTHLRIGEVLVQLLPFVFINTPLDLWEVD